MDNRKIDKPFLIWTLQRTGGTNLSDYLSRMSSCCTAQDEPFNGRREYGHLTRSWLEKKDKDELAAGMSIVCAEKSNVKHCVDRVPWAVSEALLAATVERRYNHLFLFRKNPLDRILSAEYAERTKSWGPQSVMMEGADDGAFVAPLNVETLYRDALRCNNHLNKAWHKLRKAGASPFAVSFETLYMSEPRVCVEVLRRMFKMLGLPMGATALQDILSSLRQKGNQGTSNRYVRFSGITELENCLDGLPRLAFADRY